MSCLEEEEFSLLGKESGRGCRREVKGERDTLPPRTVLTPSNLF
jgi:hypothetical protein